MDTAMKLSDPRNKDTARLHSVHEALTQFSEWNCGCIMRRDGEQLRYCRSHNPKTGTHWG